MVVVIYFLCEILAIIVCLFWLCGERIRVTYKMLGMVIIHIGLFLLCDYIGYDGLLSVLVYLVVVVYVKLEFQIPIYKALIRTVIMILLCAGMQVIAALSFELLIRDRISIEWSNLYTNLITLIIMYILYRRVNVQGIIEYVRGSNSVARTLLAGIVCIAASYISYTKKNDTINGIDYLLFFVMAIIIVFLIGTWEKARIQIKEKQIEVEVHEIYAKSYQKLIDEIRLRQHEFDNHLQAIINQQYTCTTYDELTQAQSEYINAITFDNRYNKLLRQGNSVYIGFLYGKFVSMEEQGISIEYKINIGQLKCSMPVYKIIEITSDLLNNACEALTSAAVFPQSVYYQIDETEERILLKIRNIGEPLSPDFIGECFTKNFSKKGIGRGLGLYNVKRITDQYDADIEFQNTVINHRNWISFTVTIPKPIHNEDRLS